MKKHVPETEIIPLLSSSGFIFRKFVYDSFDVPWHAHSEYEITYIQKGAGKWIIGNRVTDFSNGDLTMLAPNLPHLYKEEFHTNDTRKGAICFVIQFHKELFNSTFLNFKELHPLQNLLERAKHGLHFHGETSVKAGKIIEQMYHLSGIMQFMELMKLLIVISKSTNYEVLNIETYEESGTLNAERDKMIYNYILTHYTEEIKIEHIAQIANLSKSAFCNYFKKKTKKNFSDFINELRCGLACKLLINMELSISEIAYKTGYNNLSYFNRKFLEKMKVTPREYIQRYCA